MGDATVEGGESAKAIYDNDSHVLLDIGQMQGRIRCVGRRALENRARELEKGNSMYGGLFVGRDISSGFGLPEHEFELRFPSEVAVSPLDAYSNISEIARGGRLDVDPVVQLREGLNSFGWSISNREPESFDGESKETFFNLRFSGDGYIPKSARQQSQEPYQFSYKEPFDGELRHPLGEEQLPIVTSAHFSYQTRIPEAYDLSRQTINPEIMRGVERKVLKTLESCWLVGSREHVNDVQPNRMNPQREYLFSPGGDIVMVPVNPEITRVELSLMVGSYEGKSLFLEGRSFGRI